LTSRFQKTGPRRRQESTSKPSVKRFGDENDLDSNDLVIVDDAATREDDVVTVSYPLDDGTSVTERHTIH
jgi:hypothetical protein